MEDLQKLFLDEIKSKIPENYSLVDELSEVLNVSSDSAYRRIRGATALDINEVFILAEKYKLSLDSFQSNIGTNVNFDFISFVDNEYNSIKYLNKILDDLKQIDKFENKEIIYSAKDIPIFQLFVVPEIAIFKTFFWTKTIASLPQLENVKFSLENKSQEVLDICDEILKVYNRIPSIEIWSEQTITSILKQIEYYYDCGLFNDSNDALVLLIKLQEVLEHIKLQAKDGYKFGLNKSYNSDSGSFGVYMNDVVLPDNTIIVKKNDGLRTYLSHDVMNFLITDDTKFSQHSFDTISNVMKRSTLISSVSERDRHRFFGKLDNSIETLKKKINLN